MNDAVAAIDRAVQAQIDRLVADELPEGERRSLLAWLDEDVCRWRICAMAFLEAQSWEAAVADLPTAAEGNSTPARTASEDHGRPLRSNIGSTVRLTKNATDEGTSWRFWAALAACIVLAFGSGAISSRLLQNLLPSSLPSIVAKAAGPKAALPVDGAYNPLLATVAVRTNLDPQVPARLQVPVTQVGNPGRESPAISEYERKQWERQGFELSEERRYLPARLPDGREVYVPVNKVQVKFRGTPAS